MLTLKPEKFQTVAIFSPHDMRFCWITMIEAILSKPKFGFRVRIYER